MYQTAGGSGQRIARFGWIGESWQVFSAQPGAWVLSALIYGVIAFVIIYGLELMLILPMMLSASGSAGFPASDPTALTRSMMPRAWMFSIAIAIAMLAINAFFGGGMLKMANKQVRGFPIAVGDLFQGRDTFLRLFGCQLIFYVPIFLISSLTTFPLTEHISYTVTPSDPFAVIRAMAPVYEIGMAINIVWIILFGLFWPAAALIADGEQVVGALGKSWNAMKGSWFLAALIMLIFGILTILGIVPCFLGLLVIAPMFMILSSLMYRDMIGMPLGEAPPVPAYLYQQSNTPGIWPPPPSVGPQDGPRSGPEGQ